MLLQQCPTYGLQLPGFSVIGFSRQEYQGELHALQGIFPTQGLNLFHFYLLHWQANSLPLALPFRMAIIFLNGKYQVFSTIWRNWKRCALVVGMQNSAACLENSLVVPQMIKHTFTIRPSSCTSRYIFKRTGNISSHKNQCINVSSSITHDSRCMQQQRQK